MSWAQRLKRVFGVDITTCVHCSGTVRIVASIDELTAIRAILIHFEKHGALEEACCRPRSVKEINSFPDHVVADVGVDITGSERLSFVRSIAKLACYSGFR